MHALGTRGHQGATAPWIQRRSFLVEFRSRRDSPSANRPRCLYGWSHGGGGRAAARAPIGPRRRGPDTRSHVRLLAHRGARLLSRTGKGRRGRYFFVGARAGSARQCADQRVRDWLVVLGRYHPDVARGDAHSWPASGPRRGGGRGAKAVARDVAPSGGPRRAGRRASACRAGGRGSADGCPGPGDHTHS